MAAPNKGMSNLQIFIRDNLIQGLKEIRAVQQGGRLTEDMVVAKALYMLRDMNYNIHPSHFTFGTMVDRFYREAANYILEKEG